ncbi:hypothetical protein JCM11251_002517 [Rhodosporidiobolus azoricus]
MSGSTLWLCPPATSQLPSLVERLADAHQTNEVFSPHATLASEEIVPALPVEELVEKTKKGLEQWREQQLGDQYYQCVLATLFPEQALLSLHEAVVRQFSLPSPPPPYFPHVSLVYGDLSIGLKASIIEDLKAQGEVTELEGEEGVKIAGKKDFVPTEVLLVKTSGPCSTWEVLASIPLFDQK